jgi:serine/threonine-protein kinase
VVVKVAAAGRATEQLHTETAVLSAVLHRNVVRLWDAGTVGSLPFLVTEFLTGSGQDLLRREGRLAPDRGFRMARDFARGLRGALRAGFTHGDVKPGNLLIDSQDRGKVADFGLARRIGEAECRPLEPLAGTWQYAAPERFAGYADHRADIYSLALTLYHLLTGVPPVAGRTHRECLRAHRELVLEPLHWQLPGVPREASALLLRMASRDPDRRPNDYDEVIERLGRLEARPEDPEPAPDQGDAE